MRHFYEMKPVSLCKIVANNKLMYVSMLYLHCNAHFNAKFTENFVIFIYLRLGWFHRLFSGTVELKYTCFVISLIYYTILNLIKEINAQINIKNSLKIRKTPFPSHIKSTKHCLCFIRLAKLLTERSKCHFRH